MELSRHQQQNLWLPHEYQHQHAHFQHHDLGRVSSQQQQQQHQQRSSSTAHNNDTGASSSSAKPVALGGYTPFQWNTAPAWQAPAPTAATPLAANGRFPPLMSLSEVGRDGAYDHGQEQMWQGGLSYNPTSTAETASYPALATSVNAGAPLLPAGARSHREFDQGQQQQQTPPVSLPSTTSASYWPTYAPHVPAPLQHPQPHPVYSPYPAPLPASSTSSASEQAWAAHHERSRSWNEPILTLHQQGHHDANGGGGWHAHAAGPSSNRSSLSASIDGVAPSPSDGSQSQPPEPAPVKKTTKKTNGAKGKDLNGDRRTRRKKGEVPRDAAVRKYVCEICSEVDEVVAFSRPSALKTHQLVHTKERDFVCDVCSRAFSIQSNLTRHQKLYATKAARAMEDEGMKGVYRVEEEHRRMQMNAGTNGNGSGTRMGVGRGRSPNGIDSDGGHAIVAPHAPPPFSPGGVRDMF